MSGDQQLLSRMAAIQKAQEDYKARALRARARREAVMRAAGASEAAISRAAYDRTPAGAEEKFDTAARRRLVCQQAKDRRDAHAALQASIKRELRRIEAQHNSQRSELQRECLFLPECCASLRAAVQFRPLSASEVRACAVEEELDMDGFEDFVHRGGSSSFFVLNTPWNRATTEVAPAHFATREEAMLEVARRSALADAADALYGPNCTYTSMSHEQAWWLACTAVSMMDNNAMLSLAEQAAVDSEMAKELRAHVHADRVERDVGALLRQLALCAPATLMALTRRAICAAFCPLVCKPAHIVARLRGPCSALADARNLAHRSPESALSTLRHITCCCAEP